MIIKFLELYIIAPAFNGEFLQWLEDSLIAMYVQCQGARVHNDKDCV